MLYASDEEADAVRPAKSSSSGAGEKLAKLLARQCSCQRRVCFNQFQSCPNLVESKRSEYNGMQPAEKARQLLKIRLFPSFSSSLIRAQTL